MKKTIKLCDLCLKGIFNSQSQLYSTYMCVCVCVHVHAQKMLCYVITSYATIDVTKI